MIYKQFIANMARRNPGDVKIDALLSDAETGKALRAKIDEVVKLRKRIAARMREIKALCKFSVEDWKPEIEKIIDDESENEAVSRETRKRMSEIEHAVKVAMDENMGPGDIRTIIEIMVIGMQPGEARYLPNQLDEEKEKAPGNGSEDRVFLKTKI